jgi:hypothetical protein
MESRGRLYLHTLATSKAEMPPIFSAAFFFAANFSLARRFLEQSLLLLFLAFDAVARPGDGFQSLGVDFLAAVDAFAKVAFANANKSFIDHLQGLTIVVALTEQEFLGVGTGGAVSDVLGSILVGRAAVGLGTIHGAAQFLLPGLETFFECFQFLLIHKSL